MKYIGLIMLMLTANAWAVNPAVTKLVLLGEAELIEVEDGKIGTAVYLNYRVHCSNGQAANMVRWVFKDKSTKYCIGTGDDIFGPCESGRHAKLLIASEACGTTKRSRRVHFKCGTKRYCAEMKSCAEAQYHYSDCGLDRLDGDKDGVPCESLCR